MTSNTICCLKRSSLRKTSEKLPLGLSSMSRCSSTCIANWDLMSSAAIGSYLESKPKYALSSNLSSNSQARTRVDWAVRDMLGPRMRSPTCSKIRTCRKLHLQYTSVGCSLVRTKVFVILGASQPLVAPNSCVSSSMYICLELKRQSINRYVMFVCHVYNTRIQNHLLRSRSK
jgi:hypothetical protein